MLILGGMSFISVLELVVLFLRQMFLLLERGRQQSQSAVMRDRLSSDMPLVRVVKLHIKDAEAQASHSAYFGLN